uniref:ATP synthase subunit a n=1 Tax=Orbinia latreillii TaxID=195264 RepID=Q1X8Y6_9ANNE|nr:ATP synthase F0 subunit 6 [Orbinia latreillii]AAX50145.1 ATP synthase F0 subunit 6 [Orbinia latreillii]
MMTDLFSSFDPSLIQTSSNTQSLNTLLIWLANLIPIFAIQSFLWIAPTRTSQILSVPMTIMNDQMSRTLGKSIKGMTSIISPLFLFLILTNWTGLIPYVLPASSHLLFTLSFGLPLWLALMISSAKNSISSFTAALLPEGAPDWLNPFLTLAETISIMVRPATLSFRLAANMSAGHIVLALMGSYIISLLLIQNISLFIILMPAHMGYILFEVAMGMIQAFIFCLLLSMYSEDHSH